jgi:hypothetical protein
VAKSTALSINSGCINSPRVDPKGGGSSVDLEIDSLSIGMLAQSLDLGEAVFEIRDLTRSVPITGVCKSIGTCNLRL